MQRHTFRHLDRDWEATIADAPGEERPVRFRNADPTDERTYEARVPAEELDSDDASERELGLRHGLESALVLDALAGHEAGLTTEQVAEATGMPYEAAEDRLDVLETVQPMMELNGPRRYRTVEPAD